MFIGLFYMRDDLVIFIEIDYRGNIYRLSVINY